MRLALAAIIAITLVSTVTFAQQNAPQPSASGAPGSAPGQPAAPPHPGQEGQSLSGGPAAMDSVQQPSELGLSENLAFSRIESQGLCNVTGLSKDQQGNWQGETVQDGVSIVMMVDAVSRVVPVKAK